MTRERAKELAPIIAAYGNGATIETSDLDTGPWLKMESPDFNGSGLKYRIKPEPKRRLMTREEVLGFVAHNPHIVVRIDGDNWTTSGGWDFRQDIEHFEYAVITARGEIGEPHKFEVEDND